MRTTYFELTTDGPSMPPHLSIKNDPHRRQGRQHNTVVAGRRCRQVFLLVHTGRNRFLKRIARSGQRFVPIFAKGREFREIRTGH